MLQAVRCVTRGERGAALPTVVFVLLIVLAGGLGAIAITSGELASTYGFRARAVTESCARAAVDQIRTRLSPNPDDPLPTNISGTTTLPNGIVLSYRMGHVNGSAPAISKVDGKYYDATQMLLGEDLTNTGLTVPGVNVYKITATCSSGGAGPQEVELLVKLGVPTGG
jgi:hypothetical protein